MAEEVEEVDEEDGGGGWTYVVDVLCKIPVSELESPPKLISISISLDLHPTPWHLNPGRQHPPFGASGQLVYPLASSQLALPAHVWPLGQHPTLPASELPDVFMQLLPVPQQTSGAPIASQLLVPSGHLNWRPSSTSRTCMRASQSDCAMGRKGDNTACTVRLLHESASHLRAGCCCESEANIQLSSINISPSSRLIFFTPIGFSYCSLFWRSRPRFTRISSSGKYFRCLGTLCGHCCGCDSASAAFTAGAAQRAMMAGGNESR